MIFIIAPTFIITGQDYQVSGYVKDGYNQAISYANVLLLRPSDSTFVQGTSTDDNGFFIFDKVPTDIYYITASYVGSASELLPIDISKSTKVGTLIIDTSAKVLDEVVVNARKPIVERKIDRLIFNVENSAISQGSSWDVLKQTPGVILNRNELQIRNQAATVYINDRKVQLSSTEVKELLENYAGNQIKLVEVITNPPSSYDAEGGPILNIVTSKNISLGYKGSVNSSYTQAVFPKYSFGTSHFYKTEKLNVFVNYNFNPRKENWDQESEINFINNTNTIFSRWSSNANRNTKLNIHSTNLVLDYEFDDKNVVNATISGLFSPNKLIRNKRLVEIRNNQQILDSTFTSGSGLEEDKTNLSADVSFKHRFKEKGVLKWNGHLTKFQLDRTQDVSSDYFNDNGSFIRNFSFFTDAAQDIEIFTTQIDLETVWGGTNIETGVKGSFINSESGLDFFNNNNGIQTLNTILSDNFLYDEEVFAGYFSMHRDWEKWSIKTGIRAEHTISSGASIALSTINRLEYFELFPTFYALYTLDDNHSFAFDYARKLVRPRYEDLNPFRYFGSENDFTLGNPNLQPSFSHNFNINYTLKGEYFFDVYYRDNGKYISSLSFQDNDTQILRQVNQNVLESTSYGLDFTVSKGISNNWFLYAYTSIFHEDETLLAVESDNVPYKNALDGFYLFLGNYLTLSKDGTFTGEVGLTYLSSLLSGSYIQGSTTNLTFGLRKSLWKNRAIVSLTAEDILGKANARISSEYLNQNNSYFPRPETRFVRFGFTYNFGNYRLTDNERSINKKERERLGN